MSRLQHKAHYWGFFLKFTYIQTGKCIRLHTVQSTLTSGLETKHKCNAATNPPFFYALI